jgi:hypothetical protein
MAYGIKYYIPFNNELAESYEIFIAYDGYVGAITTLQTTGQPLTLQYINNGEDILEPIQTLEATIQIFVPAGSAITFEDFISTSDNEIYVTVRKNGAQYLFHGWVIAEHGTQQFKDAPFVIELKCTDGLGLLKNAPLSSNVGTDLVNRQPLITFLAGILSKANHELNIRTWCDLFEAGMDDKNDSPDNDMFFQTYLDVRTFLNSEPVFDDCYNVLSKILSQHFVVYYYNAAWNVVRVADFQRSGAMTYVEYDLDSQIVGSGTGDTATAKIGRLEGIIPHGLDNFKSIDFAQKKARVQFNYRIPENLVNNQKLTRLGSLIAPLSGVGYAAYQLVGWTQKKGTAWAQVAASSVNAYIKTEFDIFGYEKERYYVVEHDGTATAGPVDNFIVNDNTDFWVSIGDKLNVSVEHRLATDIAGAGLINPLMIGIWIDGTAGTSNADWKFLSFEGEWANSVILPNRDLSGAANGTDWATISVETEYTIPVDGRCFIFLGTGDLDTPNESRFKNLQIQYFPKIAGGYTEVKGDYNFYSQNANYKNSIDEEVFISDSPRRIISGSLFDNTGIALLDPTWNRLNVVETKRYSQLVAQGLYNLNYRKFRKIEGSFKGYDYQTVALGAIAHIGPMTKFEFSDTGEAKQYLCMNMRMNIKKGWFDGTFREIYDPATNDGDEVGDENEFNYLF